MSNSCLRVRVLLSTGREEIYFAARGGVEIKDGALMLISGYDIQQMAPVEFNLYAPGHWLKAECVEHDE